MTVSSDSIDWALSFLMNHSDGDLFPKILELEAVYSKKEEFIKLIENKPLNQLSPMPYRRFIVPKDEISYRQATHFTLKTR